MKRCPRCSSEISKFDKICPRCGLTISKMEEFEKKFATTSIDDQTTEGDNTKPILSKKELKIKQKEEKKAKKQAEKKARKQIEENNDTDFFKYATNSGIEDTENEILDTDTYSERNKKTKRKKAKPVFELDENGEFDIKTGDVEIVGEKTGKLIEEKYEQSYSIKKSRGDYVPPKIKWWEIYKFADRHFAKSKINKEVVKASKIYPKFIKKSKLLLLAIFLGWTGAQNFYAKNKKKGWVSIFSLILWFGIVGLSRISTFFQSIQISIGGFAGFVNIFIWISDIINIITNQFRFRIQRDAFISMMNVETRAKLGQKYIDLELYHKPWWVKLSVWFKKLKRNYQERKRDRRQRNIDKQKRELAEMENKNDDDLSEDNSTIDQNKVVVAKIPQEEMTNKSTTNDIVNEKVLSELQSFGDDNASSEEKNSNETDAELNEKDSSETSIEDNASEVRQRKVGNLYRNKYNAYNNKKSNKKKKK